MKITKLTVRGETGLFCAIMTQGARVLALVLCAATFVGCSNEKGDNARVTVTATVDSSTNLVFEIRNLALGYREIEQVRLPSQQAIVKVFAGPKLNELLKRKDSKETVAMLGWHPPAGTIEWDEGKTIISKINLPNSFPELNDLQQSDPIVVIWSYTLHDHGSDFGTFSGATDLRKATSQR